MDLQVRGPFCLRRAGGEGLPNKSTGVARRAGRAGVALGGRGLRKKRRKLLAGWELCAIIFVFRQAVGVPSALGLR
jgi:hypothetical protein